MLILVASAWAQSPPPPPPPDVSVTSLGVQTWTDSALTELGGATDVSVLLGQRLRWTVSGDLRKPGPDVLALVDAQFLLDATPPDTPVPVTVPPTTTPSARLVWNQVRQLGIEYLSPTWTVDLGRSIVYRGGPRLVDGIQALYQPNSAVKIGVWGGLAPNLFTTEPALRPGGGPIVAYETSQGQFSIVGDILTYQGALDRAGVLTQARYSFERVLDLAGRLDLDLANGPRLVDGQAVVAADPTTAVHAEVLYDGFSSYEYLQSEVLNPKLQRFAQRLVDNQLAVAFAQDTTDTSLSHLVGASLRVLPPGTGVAPKFGFVARYLDAAPTTIEPNTGKPQNQNGYLRVNPSVGVVRVADTLDLTADANYLQIDGGTQFDAGLTAYIEPPDSPVAIDTSFRAIMGQNGSETTPYYPVSGPTYYADLYVNVVSVPLDLLLIAGGEISSDPDITGQASTGIGGFLRIAKYLRPPR